MAKKISFNFGALAKPKQPRKSGASRKGSKGRTGSGRGNAWRAYVGVSNAPIPD